MQHLKKILKRSVTKMQHHAAKGLISYGHNYGYELSAARF